MDKVIIPKEVAEAIETLRNDGYDDFAIAIWRFKLSSGLTYEMPKAHYKEITVLRQIGGNILIQALVSGYEVEKTPEDTAREMFNNSESSLYRCGLIDGLMIFGHKVKGVTPDA